MFKALFYSVILSSLMLLPSCEKKKPSLEEFQNIATEFESAWKNHDPKAMANLWAEDGNLISPFAAEYKGRKEIEQHFEREHSDTMKNSQMALKVRNVRLIDPDTAFVDADMTLTGMIVGGEKADPIRDHAIFLMAKKDGKWQILIARPY